MDDNKNIIKKEIKRENNRNYTIDFITQINKYFVTGGKNRKLNIYDDSYKLLYEINDLEGSINNVFLGNQQRGNSENKNDIYLVICCEKKIYLYFLEETRQDKAPHLIDESNYDSLF